MRAQKRGHSVGSAFNSEGYAGGLTFARHHLRGSDLVSCSLAVSRTYPAGHRTGHSLCLRLPPGALPVSTVTGTRLPQDRRACQSHQQFGAQTCSGSTSPWLRQQAAVGRAKRRGQDSHLGDVRADPRRPNQVWPAPRRPDDGPSASRCYPAVGVVTVPGPRERNGDRGCAWLRTATGKR